MRSRIAAALVLLLLAGASYTLATWSYLGVAGRIHGRVEPGGVVVSFDIDAGTIYSGMEKTVNATAEVVIPEDSSVLFYAVEDYGALATNPELVNYTISVFLDTYTNYLGSFGNTKNLTTTLPAGHHTLLFIVKIKAPVVQQPLNYTLTIYMKA